MRPVSITRTLAAAVTTAIAAGQTLGGAGSFLVNGSLATGGVATIPVPSQVTLTSTGNISARTFTITGTDYRGQIISEAIAGPNNNTVTTTNTFATVTAISVNGAVGTATSLGNAQAGASPVIPLDMYLNPFNVTLELDITGTNSITVQYTNGDIFATGSLESLVWNPLGSMTAVAVNTVDSLISAVRGVRMITISGSGTSVLNVNQSGAAT
jgi:hypothetical protein